MAATTEAADAVQEQDITIIRVIAAPVARVWAAWTQAERLRD